MTLQFPSRLRRGRRIGAARAAAIAVAVGVALLAGCSKNKEKDKATQVVAKVNKEELTVSQLNAVPKPPVPASQAASANRAALEQLIDQELAIQKAADQKLDREQRVVQQIEAARREIIARAYLEKVGEGAPKPNASEVEAYYKAHPALFSERRIYNLQEVNIEASSPDQVESLKAALKSSKTFVDFVNYLKANNIKFAGAEAVRAAEQLPLTSVDAFGKMRDGQAIFNARPGGAQVINLAGSRLEPVSFDRARPAIEKFLHNERKRKIIADDMAALRSAAKIEYLGEFAGSTPPPRPVEIEPPSRASLPATLPASDVPPAAPQVEVAPIDSKGASAPTTSTLDKGLKGFK